MSDRRKPMPETDANYPVPLWWSMVAGMPALYRRPKKAAARMARRMEWAKLRTIAREMFARIGTEPDSDFTTDKGAHVRLWYSKE